MAKKRIFRQQLNIRHEDTQAIHIGDNTILHAALNDPAYLDVWFEDRYDRLQHVDNLPELRNFKVVRTNHLIPPHHTYVATVVNDLGVSYHIYREDQDE